MITKKINKYFPQSILKNLKKLVRPNKQIWLEKVESWDIAGKNSIGYDSEIIFNKVKEAALLVKEQKAAFERDGVAFYKPIYNWQLIGTIFYIILKNKLNEINILDFGGSLGSTYYQHKQILDEIFISYQWNIVEQEHYVNLGKEIFENNNLKFYKTIDAVLNQQHCDLVIFSSSLQYIEHPYEILQKVKDKNIKYIIIDLTPVIFNSEEDITTIQHINKKMYGREISYPCWLLSDNKLNNFLKDKYKRIFFQKSYLGRIKYKNEKLNYQFIVYELNIS